ncbi:class I SAM-dependent RNA methyltransferase [Cellulomonas marina]|uniref:tRNA/tmRNA/rRNA uracil-C5-methylase, TrmA/RlmC/RlmD family n=1 Tax=Cellulomonas marina TaxID=988821 RepID=A0A1I0W245_9CELL|nr:TRAM domain-containing protein [Cellulomonas marina]GIG29946.1 23S rRNA methyltransferase [Cellulomonas marina]SFA82779.1 tRNA/tmRNA/rRNA uracil-C5-methylase, TrmA/RlmC/RlmD family [Cellulomonas marina]
MSERGARPGRPPRGRRPRPRPAADPGRAGEVVELDVGAPAHGGHCVARFEGRVVFVRHTLPGERVRARLTDAGEGASFWRADAVEVLTASPDRVPSAWPEAGAGGVGGAELAHVALPAQRAWKAAVLSEQLRRIAHLDRDVPVHALPEDDERGGLHYRTRVELVADDEGRAGMRGPRSHAVHPVTSLPLAVEAIEALDLPGRRWPAGARIEAVAPASGDAPVVLVDGVPWDLGRGRPDPRPNARRTVHEEVRVRGTTYRYRVQAAGFWQVHRRAPEVLTAAVLDGLGDVTGATVLDLYAGAGLFTAVLADAVGAAGRVVGVEGDERAVRDARRTLHDRPQVLLRTGEVGDVLTRAGADADAGAPADGAADGGAGALPDAVDAVVLDPSRAGAGRRVLDAVAALAPRRVVHVACDPAALARDVGLLVGHGYRLDDVQGYDLFPMTHHVEAVAVLTRA